MAFDTTKLFNVSGAPPGFATYVYIENDDTFPTVVTSGYFNNSDDDQNMAADDVIEVRGDKGFYKLRVDTVSGGTVTTEMAEATMWFHFPVLDISTSSSPFFFCAPYDGLINRTKCILQAAIDADSVIGLELANTDVTGGDCTMVASGSAAGDVSVGQATAANAVSEGTAIEITLDGGNSDPDDAVFMVEIIPA